MVVTKADQRSEGLGDCADLAVEHTCTTQNFLLPLKTLFGKLAPIKYGGVGNSGTWALMFCL